MDTFLILFITISHTEESTDAQKQREKRLDRGGLGNRISKDIGKTKEMLRGVNCQNI